MTEKELHSFFEEIYENQRKPMQCLELPIIKKIVEGYNKWIDKNELTKFLNKEFGLTVEAQSVPNLNRHWSQRITGNNEEGVVLRDLIEYEHFDNRVKPHVVSSSTPGAKVPSGNHKQRYKIYDEVYNMVSNFIENTTINDEMVRSLIEEKKTQNKPTVSTPNSNPNFDKSNKSHLNLILYGPPGTGKTYNLVNEALKICGIFIDENDRKATQAEFKKLAFKQAVGTDKNAFDGQIAFITFHQAYSYEEFVEGIS
jgi:DNA replication protein DnaC